MKQMMKENIKVSIVIPIYNSEKSINKLLEKLVSQKYENIEIILINDGSTDNSKKICLGWTKKDLRIKYIEIENGGVSNARNIGISEATGEYICFVDSDDSISEDYIEDFILYLNEDIDLVMCNFIKYTTEEPEFDYTLNNKYEIKYYNESEKYDFIFEKYNGYVWNKIYKSKILLENNIKFDTTLHMGEDMLFNFKYIDKCKKIISFSKVNYFYKCDYVTSSKDIKNEKWFSVYSVYEQILKMKKNYNEIIYKKILYMYNKYLIEGLQRIKYLEDDKRKMYKSEISNKWKMQKNERKKLKFLQKSKLFLFYYFPNISYKYLRRKVIQ